VLTPRIRLLSYKVEEKLRPILAAIAAGNVLPPVPVYIEPADGRWVLLDGAHRFGVSIACGFPEIPCCLVTRAEADEFYRYPDGQL
jgi:ParB-like chromosome segregation protein Spo0J